jgi:hypothetical protein
VRPASLSSFVIHHSSLVIGRSLVARGSAALRLASSFLIPHSSLVGLWWLLTGRSLSGMTDRRWVSFEPIPH